MTVKDETPAKEEPEIYIPVAEAVPAPVAEAKPPHVNPAYSAPPATSSSSGARIQVPAAPTAVVNGQRQPFMQQCPNCNQKHMTRVNDEVDCTTICYCFLLYLLFWPICWVPFVVADCKKTTHYCSNCGYAVGVIEPCCCGNSKYVQNR
mmetsp:Transcript_21057/g.31418  ORF Transcript_21057/g.31418 Transcript_21057/m.31418 type:complete len:149 (-) Transcript_21057:480-926(-)